MSRISLTEVLRMIRAHRFFFLTITLISTLTVVVYTAISFSTISLVESCEEYFDDHGFYDLCFTNTAGFSTEMLAAIRADERVEHAETSFYSQALITVDGDKYAAQFYTYMNGINCPRLVSGRLPYRVGECLVEQALLDRFGLHIGDTLPISDPNGYLAVDSLIIVGSADLVTVFVTSDYYNRGSSELGDGQIATNIMVSSSAFSEEIPAAMCYLTLNDCPYRGSDEYDTLVSEVNGTLMPVLQELTDTSIVVKQAELQSQLADAKSQYAAGTQAVAAAESQLRTMAEELSDGRAQIDAQRDLLKVNYHLSDEAIDLQLSQYESLYSEKKAEYDGYMVQLQEKKAELSDAEKAIDRGEALLDSLAKTQLHASDIYVNPAYNAYTQYTRGTDQVVATLCSLLVAISILVCFTIISRMVTEDHRIIGTQKALGFRDSEICLKYILYVLLCSLIGGALGLLCSYTFVQDIVYRIVYGDAYIMQDFVPRIYWPTAITIVLLEQLCLCFSAILAGRQMLKKSAIALLNSEFRDHGVRRNGKERRLPLPLLMTLRNLRGNPQILLTTIVSVVGCTVMMIAVLTVHHAMSGIAPRQFHELQRYNGTLTLDTTASDEEIAALKSYTEQSTTVSALPVMERFVSYRTAAETRYATLLCLDSGSNYDKYLQILDITDDSPLSPPTDGVLICRKMAENYGYGIGDTLMLLDPQGTEYPAAIVGIFDWHIGMEIITSSEYYASLTGEPCSFNQYFIMGTQAQIDRFVHSARSYAAYCSYTNSAYYETEMEYKVSCVTDMVLLITVGSAMLSLFVLFTLALMNIIKKERELVVMKTLGFADGDAYGYVFWESMFMCALGVLMGIAAGGPIGSFLELSIELENLQDIRGISISACAIGGSVNLLFCLLANLFSLRRIRAISMVGSAREA